MLLTDAIIALAVWRISVLLMDDDGPFLILSRLRTRLGVYDLQKRGGFADLFNCMYCMSFWVAISVVLVLYLQGDLLPYAPLRALAYSGASVILDYKMTGKERSAR